MSVSQQFQIVLKHSNNIILQNPNSVSFFYFVESHSTLKMIGTLTSSIGVRPLRSPVNSTGKVKFRQCTAVLHVADAELAVNSTANGRHSSFYEVLRVKRNATPNEIKAAYRNLAKVFHPDVLDVEQHDERKFIEIHNAYVTLTDPAERAMYDTRLNDRFGRRSVYPDS
ncbi:chaperone protein dnaJ A7A, chloroplastic-like [Rutidosis leptorrhynchoides]|uniref:chaperone protein dnaJ A7A, chloroplastic-like n=1 Tax=Rutidosis leptorrhynchoides TaxID=125765 RepID=UPI003A9A3421